MQTMTLRIVHAVIMIMLVSSFGSLTATAAVKAKKEPAAKEQKTKEQPKKEQTTKEISQQAYMKFLEANGYHPELDKDGDVTFKHEGGNYIIQVDENDNVYFRLIYPNFWEIESEEERQEVLIAANVANSDIKCAKVFMLRDNVWAVVEIYLTKPDDYEKLLSRSISSIQSVVGSFRSKMQELKSSRIKPAKS